MADLVAEYSGRDVPRPPYWGGFLLRATVVELWAQGSDRLHDRVRYEMNEGVWTAQRLSP
jgi:pyridoxamine 5'-phosphate oxidase